MRIRKIVNGTPEQPRMTVFRSNKQIYVQFIDDLAGVTLATASSKEVVAEAALLDAEGNEIKTGDKYFFSEEVRVTYIITKTDVGVDNVAVAAVVYSTNGSVYVQAEAGTMIEVFTVQGHRIYAAEATSDLTAIAVDTNIVLVRVAGQTITVAVR